MRIYFNDNWQFKGDIPENINVDSLAFDDSSNVRIPHTVKELPFHYFDEHDYQMISAYKKTFTYREEWKGKVLLLTFDGVAHVSKVYLNGSLIGEHNCGYTAFTLDITSHVSDTLTNELVVIVDSRENVNVPPFGFVIDYLTYGGIYRDVYLDVKSKSYIEDAFVHTKENRDIISEISLVNAGSDMSVNYYLKKVGEPDYELIMTAGTEQLPTTITIDNPCIWDVEDPNLYVLKVDLVDAHNCILDTKEIRFGFRTIEFLRDGFYLNGRKLKLRGLNRHQSYPYVGYAMPESMQKLDADILKNELGLNSVRTSHYPQSHYFLDRCDEIGLLVFTEIPGWQYIGDKSWQDQAVINVEDMVKQYRNHTSIILWGVRINESADNDEFYSRTNKAAHELDVTRSTGGVRCYKNSSLLEDVYTYNDFSHDGKAKGCEPKSQVTSNNDKPYLISEYNGHMFPCKTFDNESKRLEHALRHVRVLDEVAKQSDIAGSFGWCMFDYNTHKDFGSGDKICYHGVMDMFRNPKLASAAYSIQQDKKTVLEISSTMDIGEQPASIRGDVYIFTNADSVRMYKDGIFLKEYDVKNSSFSHIKRGPIRVDDYIGNMLVNGEKMSVKKSEAVKEILNETAIVGLNNLSKKTLFKGALISLKYGMKMSDAVGLYDKYVGNWGGKAVTYTFEGITNGKVVATKKITSMRSVMVYAKADHTTLIEKNTYDVALVRIKATNEDGNVLPFCNDVAELNTEGPIELIGPKNIAFQGGMFGTYIRTTGVSGKAKLKVILNNGATAAIEFNVIAKN